MKRTPEKKTAFKCSQFFAVLLLAVTLGLSVASAGEPFTPEETNAIEKIIRDYIMKNPEIIKDAGEILGKKREVIAQERTRRTILARKDELFQDPASPVGDNPRGDVTIVAIL